MKCFLILMVLTNIAFGATWTTGDYKVELQQDSAGDWASAHCLRECSIDLAAKDYLKSHEITGEDLSGGKNPGSVLCHRINGKVVYLEQSELSDAFCELDGATVELSRLARFVLQ